MPPAPHLLSIPFTHLPGGKRPLGALMEDHVGPLSTPLCRSGRRRACACARRAGSTSAERRRRQSLQKRRRRRRRRQGLIAPRRLLLLLLLLLLLPESSVSLLRLLLLLRDRIKRSVARAASLVAHGVEEKEVEIEKKTRESFFRKSEIVDLATSTGFFFFSPLHSPT